MDWDIGTHCSLSEETRDTLRSREPYRQRRGTAIPDTLAGVTGADTLEQPRGHARRAEGPLRIERIADNHGWRYPV